MEIPVTGARVMFDQAVFGAAQASPAGDWQFLNDRLAGEISSSSLENRYVPEGRNHHVGQAVCLSSKGSRLTGRTVPSC